MVTTAPLASDPGSEPRHPTMGMLGVHVDRLEREIESGTIVNHQSMGIKSGT